MSKLDEYQCILPSILFPTPLIYRHKTKSIVCSLPENMNICNLYYNFDNFDIEMPNSEQEHILYFHPLFSQRFYAKYLHYTFTGHNNI